MTPKMVPKTWGRNGAGRFGALLGHLWRPSPFFYHQVVPKAYQNAPKVTPRWPKWLQMDPPSDKSASKIVLNLSKNSKAPILQNWLQRWPKNTTPTTTALQCCPDLAWRTARSAYNKQTFSFFCLLFLIVKFLFSMKTNIFCFLYG